MDKLLGVWISDSDHQQTLEAYGNVSFNFKDSGELIYSIFEDGKKQEIFLTYHIEDDLIITDQPSSPSRVETKFLLEGSTLILINDQIESHFLRV